MSTKPLENKDDDYSKNDYIGILANKVDIRKKSEVVSDRKVGYYKFSKP